MSKLLNETNTTKQRPILRLIVMETVHVVCNAKPFQHAEHKTNKYMLVLY